MKKSVAIILLFAFIVMFGRRPQQVLERFSVEDLDSSDFGSTDTYFECLLLPNKR